MAQEEIVVAKIVGEELRVERYGLQRRSESSFHCPGDRASTEDPLEEVVRRVRPHLLMWSAGDPRGRRLAEALEIDDGETQWRPGCVEVERWTDVPLSEVLILMRRVGSDAAEGPSEAAREVDEGQTIQKPPAPERPAARWEDEGHQPHERWEELGDRLELVLAARAKRDTAVQGSK